MPRPERSFRTCTSEVGNCSYIPVSAAQNHSILPPWIRYKKSAFTGYFPPARENAPASVSTRQLLLPFTRRLTIGTAQWLFYTHNNYKKNHFL